MGKIFDKVFLKFILVGLINTAVGTGVMFGAYNLLGWSYWVSSAANYAIGSVVSYVLNKNYTFQNKERSKWTILKFIINISVCYGIAYGAAKPLVRWVLQGVSQKMAENAAMLTGMCFFVILNYLGQRFFTFARKDNRDLT